MAPEYPSSSKRSSMSPTRWRATTVLGMSRTGHRKRKGHRMNFLTGGCKWRRESASASAPQRPAHDRLSEARLENISSGCPHWTGLSTNASCQQRNRRIWKSQPGGPRATLGLSALPQEVGFPTGENRSNKHLRNVWDMDAAKNGSCQPKRGFELVPEGGVSPLSTVSNFSP